MLNYLHITHPFRLEHGGELPQLRLAYHTYGTLNAAKDNVIWITHALTGNSDAADWWPGLVGKGCTIDLEQYFIVCVNMLGSCYGSSNPQDIDPTTGKVYGENWPLVTTRDFARVLELTANYLGIRQIRLLMGGSMGGQHALEWAVLNPDRFDLLCVMATNARHSAWGIAFNETQRMALRADPTLWTNAPNAGRAGLEAARAIGMLSYRHYRTYVDFQTGLNQPPKQREAEEEATEGMELQSSQFSFRSANPAEDYRAASYQRYQGRKLWDRYEPTAYYALGRGMDSHDLGRGRATANDPEGIITALERITAKSLVIGIDTDILFPLEEQGLLSRYIRNSRFEVIHSDYGHDGFLTEAIQIGELLSDFLADQLNVDDHTKHAFTESLTGRKFAFPGTEDV